MAVFTRKHRVKSERIHEGGIINFRLDTIELPSGERATREVVEHNGGVVVACRPQPDQILLINQYRYSIDADLLELPAGRIEKGEDPLLAAKRELEEETGYLAGNWREMVRMYTAPGFCDEILYVYEASDLKFVGIKPDADEEIEVKCMKISEAWQLVLEGKVNDAKTIAGLGMLMHPQYS